jgi:hypothetical protein
MNQRRLFRLLWLSIAAAIATISLKTVAWLLTGSVGLLSDAAESVVNLVAAVVAMAALRWATKPADEEHAYDELEARSTMSRLQRAVDDGNEADLAAAAAGWRQAARLAGRLQRQAHAIADEFAPCVTRLAQRPGSGPYKQLYGTARRSPFTAPADLRALGDARGHRPSRLRPGAAERPRQHQAVRSRCDRGRGHAAPRASGRGPLR